MQKKPTIKSNADTFVKTDSTTLQRLPQRGTYDKAVVYQILDEAFICHVGFIVDGRPFVIPTSYGRINDNLYIHGAAASRMLRSLQTGIDVCVTVTLLDGLVLARSIFDHSMNYRSVVILGHAKEVTDKEQKLKALYAFSEHVISGRWQDVRKPNKKELAATMVLSVPLQEVSAKIRSGPPIDDPDDMNLPVWAGEIPLAIVAGQPVADPHILPNIDLPEYAKHYRRGRCKSIDD